MMAEMTGPSMTPTSERGWLTTGQAAALMNDIIEMPGAYSTDFVRKEVAAGYLHARVNFKSGKKYVIKIHPNDFIEWATSKISHTQRPKLERIRRP